MGYFEACANPFRSDSAGRRVIAPFPLRGRVYLVPDDADAARIKAGVKWLRISLFAFIILSTPMNLGLIRMIAIVIVGSELWMYLLTRGLPIADVKRADLPRMPYRERAAREEAAFGKPTLWVGRTLGLAMNGFFLWGALRYGDIELWLGTALFALVNIGMLFASLQARSYRHSLAAPHSA